MNLFDVFWPELYDLDFVHILRTPVILVTLKDKTQIEFFTERAYQQWEEKDGAKLKGWTRKFYKGLSSWSTVQFANFFNNLPKYLYRVDMEDEHDKEEREQPVGPGGGGFGGDTDNGFCGCDDFGDAYD